MTLPRFLALLDLRIQEADPLDGIFETIAEQYDPQNTGICKYEHMIAFLEEYNYLNALKQAVLGGIEPFHDRSKGIIYYKKAIKAIVQD